jgi:hypothetical protein
MRAWLPSGPRLLKRAARTTVPVSPRTATAARKVTQTLIWMAASKWIAFLEALEPIGAPNAVP